MYLKVNVTPSAKKDSIEETGEGKIAVSVRAPARNNMANHRVCEMIAEYFQVPDNTVRIINGHHTRSKMVSIGE